MRMTSEGEGDLADRFGGDPRGHAAPVDGVGEVLAGEELHRVVGEALPSGAAGLLGRRQGVDVVDADDVRVIERGGGLGLALEALDDLVLDAPAYEEDLEGDLAAQVAVVGAVDDAHAAAAQLRDDAVAAHQQGGVGRVSVRGEAGEAGRLPGRASLRVAPCGGRDRWLIGATVMPGGLRIDLGRRRGPGVGREHVPGQLGRALGGQGFAARPGLRARQPLCREIGVRIHVVCHLVPSVVSRVEDTLPASLQSRCASRVAGFHPMRPGRPGSSHRAKGWRSSVGSGSGPVQRRFSRDTFGYGVRDVAEAGDRRAVARPNLQRSWLSDGPDVVTPLRELLHSALARATPARRLE